MSLRDLVTGSDACTPSDGAGPSNAVGAFVNTLLGSAAKTQEQLRELPVVQPGLSAPAPRLTSASAIAAGHADIAIPGLAPGMGHADLERFFRPPGQAPSFDEFEQIYNQQQMPGPGMMQPPMHPPVLPPAAAAAVGNQLQAFMHAARSKDMFRAPPLPPMDLPVAEQCRIRDRATIIARQMYADQSAGFADQQVGALLSSLNINAAALPGDAAFLADSSWDQVWAQPPGLRPHQPPLGAEMAVAAHHHHMEAAWRQQQRPPGPPSTGWAEEFVAGPSSSSQGAAWAEHFHAQRPPGESWAEEFSTAQPPPAIHSADGGAALESTRRMVDVLSRDADPKMRNSKFLQFVSKMSRGELLLEDNKVVERPAAAANDWASEFSGTQSRPGDWAGEFQQQQHSGAGPSTSAWADEFAGPSARVQQGDWADEFAKGVAGDLGNLSVNDGEFESVFRQVAEGDSWAQEFDGEQEAAMMAEWDRLYAGTHEARSGEYVFAKDNPFLGDPEALSKAKDLFRRGVLSEAALALEAEVQAHPMNAEAWRLLGTVHAENDDDRQAIAAMNRAYKADPNDPDVLLSMGVSHTNELDTREALDVLQRWLATQTRYSDLVAAAGPVPDSSQRQSHTLRLFEQAAALHPEDAEVCMALGVLHHLSRQYQAAVDCFKRALQQRPSDYSLWNKLGATLANHSHSADAIGAYHKALDLKPNYMRAWTNLGISHANIGDYDASCKFYIRALQLNPQAHHVWGYLRTALACAGRVHLMTAVDSQDLEPLVAELPL